MDSTYEPPSGVSRTGRRILAGVAALAVVASAAVGLRVASAAEPQAETAAAGTSSAINGFRSVGYFAQWGVYGRGYQVKQIDTSGVADELTHINYAFANIHHQNLECFEANKAQGEGPNGSDGAGDAWADYGMGYTAANSVSGAADTWDQPLAGSFNQLKQLKAKHPDLKVMMSIGGWTWSKNFSLAAATEASREKFVSSCVNMFIKGNLPVIDGRGGTGAAAGVFDGFDIDWEWPGSQNGNVGNHVDEVNDARNFKLLLAEFREQLDAVGAETGKHYELSAFLPANPADIEDGGWNDPEIFEYLDFGNVQGYDLHGAWDPALTGHQGNLYHDPADPREAARQFSVDLAVREYTDAGIDPAQLGLGLAMYGRGWTGASSSAAWGTATGAAPGQWEAGINDYDVIKNVGTGYYDANLGAAWRHDGSTWWSYDNNQSVTKKAEYIRSQGLGGAMWWDLSGDRSGALTGALWNVLGSGTPGPVEDGGSTDPSDPPTDPSDPPTDPSDPPTDPPGDACASAAWSSSAVYVGGNTVSYAGHEWRAKWWTQGETPGTTGEWGVWQDLGAC
ncbi:glycosyl hydrolase family 18 protein [Promicromonospora sp. NPDC050880]|uniref:glycosyl hydrolase family 18 protein n=1 Tax=Promicromonospora sp. NPDC050880 TaxID=3364406 RepID=UPI00378A03AA